MVQYKKDRKARWVAQVRDQIGKMRSKSFDTRIEAQQYELFEKSKRRMIQAGMKAPRETVLFFDYARQWVAKRYATKPQSTVRQDDSRLRNYWIPKFGPIPLQQIQPNDIREELDRIQFKLGHSPADRNRHRALLHKLFRDAFIDEKIDENPVSRVELVDERRKTRAPHFLSMKEQADYLLEMHQEGPQFKMLAELLIWTGARVCSANVIQYQDIDFDRGIVRIRRLEERATRSVQERQKGLGEGGETALPLFPPLRTAILNYRLRSSYRNARDYVAARPDGNYICYDLFRAVHRRVVKRLKLSHITIHDLRRTFATNCEKAGYSKSEIKEMLGHSTISVTEKYTMKDVDHLVEKGKKIGFGQELENNVISIGGQKS